MKEKIKGMKFDEMLKARDEKEDKESDSELCEIH